MVHNAILHYGSNGSAENKERKCRPKKTTPAEDRLICRTSKANPFLSSKQIYGEISPQLTNGISTRTIRRRLLEGGLRGCIARKKPHVSKNNLKRRIQFAKEHAEKPLAFWKLILWSDESKFNLFGSDGKKYVRRPINKELDPRYTLKTIKHGGGNIMVWAAFSWFGVGPIRRISERMDQNVSKYIYW